MYTIEKKGKVLTKLKASKLTAKLLIELVDVYGYTIRGTYKGFSETIKDNKLLRG